MRACILSASVRTCHRQSAENDLHRVYAGRSPRQVSSEVYLPERECHWVNGGLSALTQNQSGQRASHTARWQLERERKYQTRTQVGVILIRRDRANNKQHHPPGSYCALFIFYTRCGSAQVEYPRPPHLPFCQALNLSAPHRPFSNR